MPFNRIVEFVFFRVDFKNQWTIFAAWLQLLNQALCGVIATCSALIFLY
jgi:hypothetical protein